MEENIMPAEAAKPLAESASPMDQIAKALLLSRLRTLEHGSLRIIDQRSNLLFGGRTSRAPFEVTIRVRDPRFYSQAVFGGTTGAGEAYMGGLWDCDDLTALVRLMVINRELMDGVDSGWSRVRAPLLHAAHWLKRNTQRGSRRNIAAHYDLGNEFFQLFLDDTMAYSCGIFNAPEASLRSASLAKFDAALGKLAIKPGQHLLEIGTGWGGLAMHAARHYGCRVTTTTISRKQYEFAREQVARAGLQRQITLLLEDYRELRGEYDALVSIEMVEAVGHQYLDSYFRQCGRLLSGSGAMLLQAITIRDQFYQQALHSVDFIKRHIFPGSFIPSIQALIESVARSSDMKLFHLEDIGPHYARTMRLWREGLQERRGAAHAQGLSDSFLRMWEYYLCYCEGGFEERQLGDVQMLLTKPQSRRAALATVHAPPA